MNRHSRRDFLKTTGLGAAALASGGRLLRGYDEDPPLNFVFFLIDDLGWTDLGCFGSKLYETPNIDKLAKEGVRFTNAYASCPVCSPTRASIVTGKYAVRMGFTNYGKKPLPPKEKTFAQILKEDGYTTFFAGKWHLGDKPEHWPDQKGFDYNVGGNETGQPKGGYFSPYKNPQLSDGPEGEYLTDRLTDESIKFLDKHKDKPFLLYLSHYTVHTPLQAKKEAIDRYKKKIAAQKPDQKGPTQRPEGKNGVTDLVQDHPVFAAMVQSLDESVGRIMEKVKALGIAGRTVVMFVSDNGGLSTLVKRRALAGNSPTCNLPLRAGKGWVYEGGIRVPMIIKWPGVAKPGSICEKPVISMDFYPTILRMARLMPRPEQHVDGVSLTPLLKGEPGFVRDTLCWHYPHKHGSGSVPSGAIRKGNDKLIEFYEDKRIELYNLKNDIGEQHNLAAAQPAKVKALHDLLKLWRLDVGVSKDPIKLSLFDGKTMGNWIKSDFYDPGKITIKNGEMHLAAGNDMTGVTWNGPVVRKNYEITLDAKRVKGYDFFCGLTFPVGIDPCTFVIGGWGGEVVGLSNVDYFDAANNETARAKTFTLGKWYRIRLRVTDDTIQAWIDDEEFVNLMYTTRKIDVRIEVESCIPLGLSCWRTAAAYRNIKLESFRADE